VELWLPLSTNFGVLVTVACSPPAEVSGIITQDVPEGRTLVHVLPTVARAAFD
jgi:hypothetical protein